MIFNAYQDSDRGLAGCSVVSSGHIFAERGRTIHRPKGRPDYLLFYVAKGTEQFSLPHPAVAQAGSFLLFRPDEPQLHVHADEERGEFYYVHFTAPRDFDLFGFASSHVYNTQPSSSVCDLFEDIIEELQTKRHAYEAICMAKLFCILALLERKITKESSPIGQYTNQISFVIQTMNKDYEKNLTLEDFAALCHMSKFHFTRVFKEITGKAPLEYRNKIRLEHAKELLLDTSYPISEIGRRVGYVSSIYFCDAFKKKLGISPSQYRNQYRQR